MDKKRKIRLLEIEIIWNYDCDKIEIVSRYGKIFDDEKLPIAEMKEQVDLMKNNCLEGIYEVLGRPEQSVEESE